MSRQPLAVFGIPLYNHAEQLPETLESLLSQQYDDCRFVAVDDVSGDGTEEIVREYASLDTRLEYVRNDRRLGMVGNWRRSFELALRRYPDARYFAWASDHDLWHPRWLPSLARELSAHPEAVLAYPIHYKVTVEGSPKGGGGWRFDTAGEPSPGARFRRAVWRMSAGNMVYGLFRVDALRRAGVFRRSLLPDRLLLTELALQGEFRQVPEILWYRRHEGNFSLERQRRALFGESRPAWSWIPWWISHPVILGWNLVVRGSGKPAVGRARGLATAAQYSVLSIVLHFVRGARRLQKRHIPRYVAELRRRLGRA